MELFVCQVIDSLNINKKEGKLLQSGKFFSGKKIDITNLNSGFYSLKIVSISETINKMLIVK